MINEMMNLLFRSCVPYDPEKNEFRVRPEHLPMIEHQRDLMEQDERWFSSSRLSERFPED